jgi:hypothetical protein
MSLSIRQARYRALCGLFPRLTVGRQVRLRAVICATGTVASDEMFIALCDGVEQLRHLVASYPLDLRNDLSPQRRADRYRRAATLFAQAQAAIKDNPPPFAGIDHLAVLAAEVKLREQVFDDFVAATEAIEGEDADADAIVRDRRDWLDQIPSVVKMLLKAADIADDEEPRLRGRNPALPPGLIDAIISIWTDALGRPKRTSVEQGYANGPLVRFGVACCALLGFDRSAGAIRAAIRRHGQK